MTPLPNKPPPLLFVIGASLSLLSQPLHLQLVYKNCTFRLHIEVCAYWLYYILNIKVDSCTTIKFIGYMYVIAITNPQLW